MDITRNWRLKTSRIQLLATRDPETGVVMLPGSTIMGEIRPYDFSNTHESGVAGGNGHIPEASASISRERSLG